MPDEDRAGSRSRIELFDRWARDYDRSVAETAQSEAYPFAGYDAVIGAISRETPAGSTVLDLGTGTGVLARRVADAGSRVWGTDVSAEMLVRARERVPEATLVQADLREAWPPSIAGPFDRIVSAYVFHEFDMATRLDILREATRRLTPEGLIVIGDVAFDTRAALERARDRWRDRWDDSEHYWVATEAIECAREARLHARWTQVSACAGVFVFTQGSCD